MISASGKSAATAISVAIPTYGRDEILTATIRSVAELKQPGDEILIIDQTVEHNAATEGLLTQWQSSGLIRWVRLEAPSITRAMNTALLVARNDIVLFLDDDLIADVGLLEAHRSAHCNYPGAIIAGRVLQPWHKGNPDPHGRPFGFNSLEPRDTPDFMGGNFSVSRTAALKLGGFDENFVRVAYRFEAEFALRWRRSGNEIHYAPAALINHLKAPSGGTRVHGEHLRTARPGHSVGEYYFLFQARPPGWVFASLRRIVKSVLTKHHLRRPWWIPVTLIAEISGFCWAVALSARGPKLVTVKE